MGGAQLNSLEALVSQPPEFQALKMAELIQPEEKGSVVCEGDPRGQFLMLRAPPWGSVILPSESGPFTFLLILKPSMACPLLPKSARWVSVACSPKFSGLTQEGSSGSQMDAWQSQRQGPHHQLPGQCSSHHTTRVALGRAFRVRVGERHQQRPDGNAHALRAHRAVGGQRVAGEL